jgi:hypothetical protein
MERWALEVPCAQQTPVRCFCAKFYCEKTCLCSSVFIEPELHMPRRSCTAGRRLVKGALRVLSQQQKRKSQVQRSGTFGGPRKTIRSREEMYASTAKKCRAHQRRCLREHPPMYLRAGHGEIRSNHPHSEHKIAPTGVQGRHSLRTHQLNMT